MPSTPKRSEATDYFSYPTRRGQDARPGVRPPTAGHVGSADILCIQLVDFGGIVLDYEGLALVYGARRTLLTPPEFRFMEALLWAEEDGATTGQLAVACLVRSPRHERDMIHRISFRLRTSVLVDPGVAVLELSADVWRLVFRRPLPRP